MIYTYSFSSVWHGNSVAATRIEFKIKQTKGSGVNKRLKITKSVSNMSKLFAMYSIQRLIKIRKSCSTSRKPTTKIIEIWDQIAVFFDFSLLKRRAYLIN